MSLAQRLRSEDADELIATTGLPPVLALPQSVGLGTLAAELNGTVEAVFGCVRRDDTTGSPWLLASSAPMSDEWVKVFLRASRQIVEEWQRDFPRLHNYTDARNTVHHRWLRWLGFTFTARHETFGPLGLPFYEFVRIAPCAVGQRPSPGPASPSARRKA